MSESRISSIGASRCVRLLVSLGLCLLLLIQTAGAFREPSLASIVDPVGQSDNCSAVMYDNTSGLPTSEANAIAQTGEGFIWIGSYGGLVRYDGNTFERMDPSLGITGVVSLLVDSRDRLWIGTNDCGLALLDHGAFRIWTDADGLPSDKVRSLVEGGDGTIYVGTTEGIAVISPDMGFRTLDDPRIGDVYLLRRGTDGTLYCITNYYDLCTLRNGEVVDYYANGSSAVRDITALLPDPYARGKVYIGTETSTLYYGDLSQGMDSMEGTSIEPLYNVNNIRQIGNQVWICARNGIGVLDSQGFHLLGELPMNNSVSDVIADYQGNLWFTSTRQGVMKVVWNQFSNLFQRCGLPEQVINSTCMYDGRLFIGTDTGLIVLDGNEPASALPLTRAVTASGQDLEATDLLEMVNGSRIRSILPDSQGRLWISLWGSYGLLRYDGEAVTAFTVADGMTSDHNRAVCERPDGSILVACLGGADVIRDDRVIASYGEADGIVNPETLAVASAPNGDMLLGSNGGGIYIITEEGLRCIGEEDGLQSGVVMRIKHDDRRDLFWIVTGNSIAYMTEDYQVTTVKGFPCFNNFDLYQNSKDEMWILSSDGIYVVPTKEMVANGPIQFVLYTIFNGLPFTAVSNSYSALTPEGDLYIAGNAGVSKVNIESSAGKPANIRQAVPYIEADGTRIFPDGNGAFTISSGVHKLTIYGYVLNYSLSDPQVSYRLEGFDQEAVTISCSELAPVIYTNLPGGSYRFVMELKGAMGRENKILSVPIVKEKALVEKPWFFCLVGLVIALIAAALVRMYVLRKMRALEEKHREEAERQRIGGELKMAAAIQESRLPHTFPPFPGRREFDLYAIMDPAREVGGDFYDFFLIDDDHLCLVIADVSGKGIPASLFMMTSMVTLQSIASLSRSPAEILTRTNETLCVNNQTNMFVTVWLGILEISTGRLAAANAGHEYPVLKQADGPYKLFKDTHGLIIGYVPGVQFPEYELQLSPGDRLFVYTDGVPEAADANEQFFGTDRMLAALNEDAGASPRELLENVRRAVDEYAGDTEQFDDLTMLCLEYRGPADDVTVR